MGERLGRQRLESFCNSIGHCQIGAPFTCFEVLARKTKFNLAANGKNSVSATELKQQTSGQPTRRDSTDDGSESRTAMLGLRPKLCNRRWIPPRPTGVLPEKGLQRNRTFARTA